MGVVVVIVLGGSTRRVITHDARKEVSKAKYESRIPQLSGMSVGVAVGEGGGGTKPWVGPTLK